MWVWNGFKKRKKRELKLLLILQMEQSFLAICFWLFFNWAMVELRGRMYSLTYPFSMFNCFRFYII